MKFDNINDAIDFVVNRRNENLGFEHFKNVINKIGNPINKIKTIHIAGTNGKGSVTNYLQMIYENEGYKVGIFVSPHLYHHNDRIRINDIEISDERLLYYINKNYDFIIENQLNMFEIDFLIMSLYFVDEKVDLAIIETGLGGRLDATNVLDNPLLTIITTIGKDHMDRLGNSLSSIAYEKAGIVKNKVPCLVGYMDDGLVRVIDNVCYRKNSHLYRVDKLKKIDKFQFEYRNERYELNNIADYQKNNAAVALEAIDILKKEYGINYHIDLVKKSLNKSLWKGRFQNLTNNIYVDGAHNIDGVKALKRSIEQLDGKKRIVCTILKDKEYLEMLNILNDCADELYISSFDFYRGLSFEDINKIPFGIKIKDFRKLFNYALKDQEYSTIFCGSLYFISDVLNYYNENFRQIKS